MSEKRFTLDDEENGLCRCILVDGEEMPTCEICELLNKQQDQISYWKHKVYSLLWILGQFDEEKVKGLLKELEDE